MTATPDTAATSPGDRDGAALARLVDEARADLERVVPADAVGVAPSDRRADAETRFARIVWSCTIEPGDTTAGRLIAALGPVASIAALFDADPLAAIARALHARGADVSPRDPLLVAAVERWRPRLDPTRAQRLTHAAASIGGRAIVPGDASWPATLDDLGPAVPPVLWVRGDAAADALDAVAEASIAIVGSRAATRYGEQVAIDLADGLALRGCAIVSGGAYGIDIAAHRAALAVERPTVVVLAGGVDRLYPQGNASVLERVVEHGGAIVSESPCGQAPTKWRFLQRNRLIAALSHATVVVEAGHRSGALNTAGHAAEIGRPLGAVPGPVTSAASVGCHRLIREYGATLVTGPAQAMELLEPFAVDAAPTLPGLDRLGGGDGIDGGDGGDGGMAVRERPLGPDATRAWDALSARSARTVADLAERSGLSAAEARGALVELELEGRARSDGAGWRRVGVRPV